MTLRRISQYASATIPVWICLLLFTCKEEFPPYETPQNVLQAELDLVAPDTIVVYYGSAGYNVQSGLALRLRIRNMHDDLLQGKARVVGEVYLQSFGAIPRAMLAPFTKMELRTPPIVQGNIALGPWREAELIIPWQPYGTDGNIIFAGFPPVPLGSDLLYGPIDILARTDVQLFENVQSMRLPEKAFRTWFRVILMR
jgi:hypothetical protein